MKRLALAGVLLTAALSGCTTSSYGPTGSAVPHRPPWAAGRREDAALALDVEWLWAQLSFDLGLTEEQKRAAEPHLAAAWRERNSYFSYAAENENADWKVIGRQLEEARERLQVHLSEILSEEQLATLVEREKDRKLRSYGGKPERTAPMGGPHPPSPPPRSSRAAGGST